MTALLCFAFPCSFTWDVPRYRLHAFLAYLRVILCWLGMREFRLYYILLSIFACIVILALQRLCVFLLQCSKDCAPPPKPIPTTCGLLPPHIASCAQPLVDSLPALSSILIIIIKNSSSYYSCLPHRTHGPVASSSSSFQNTLHCSFTYGGTSSTFCASSGACTTTIAMPAARCQSM